MAAYITSQKLIVDGALLQKKANKRVLENMAVRTEQVRNFLQFFKPSIVLDITPIVDVYGPALVVSKETTSGAEAITSSTRTQSSFPSNLPHRRHISHSCQSRS